jgi:hypothetical protein
MRHPSKEDKVAWSAVGGVMTTAFVSVAIACWPAATSPTPPWPAFLLGGLVLASFYLLLMPLLGLPGWPPVEEKGATEESGSADGAATPAPAGRSPAAELRGRASTYVGVLKTPSISSRARRKAAGALRRAAENARDELPVAADLALSLADTTDRTDAQRLEEELRQQLR